MKLQRISDIQGHLSLFPLSEDYDLFYQRFFKSKLGQIYSTIPWISLV